LLVSRCVGGECYMVEVGDLVWRIGNDQVQVSYSVDRQLEGWVTTCVICIVHVEETRSAGFLVYPQNQW
jgi:hypothetical protein